MLAPQLPDPDDFDGGDQPTEQDLLVRLRLSNRALGTANERLEIEQLADQLEAAVLDAKAGEYDGDEMGGGECILFFCGADAERLFAVLQPLLRKHPLARGATIQMQTTAGATVTRPI